MANQEDGFAIVTAGELFYVSEDSPLSSDPEKMAHWRLVFLGVSPGILHVGYRESTENRVRPAHDLNLNFCSSGQFFFTVKGERFEVNRVDNDGLEIRHVAK